MSAGRPLEPVGDGRPRWMTATSGTRYRTRRTGRLVRHALVMVLAMAVDLAIRTSVLVDGGQYWSTFDGPTTARTAQRRPSGDHLVELAISFSRMTSGEGLRMRMAPYVLVAALVLAGLVGLAAVPIARSSPEILHPAAPLKMWTLAILLLLVKFAQPRNEAIECIGAQPNIVPSPGSAAIHLSVDDRSGGGAEQDLRMPADSGIATHLDGGELIPWQDLGTEEPGYPYTAAAHVHSAAGVSPEEQQGGAAQSPERRGRPPLRNDGDDEDHKDGQHHGIADDRSRLQLRPRPPLHGSIMADVSRRPTRVGPRRGLESVTSWFEVSWLRSAGRACRVRGGISRAARPSGLCDRGKEDVGRGGVGGDPSTRAH
jgi:hypothetical protein